MPKALFFLVLCSSLPLCAQAWLSVGIKGGVPLTSTIQSRSLTQVLATVPSEFFSFTETVTTNTSGGARTLLLGPTVEARLPLGLSVEADALYRQIHLGTLQTTNTLSRVGSVTFPITGTSSRFNLWEFPVLAKYRLPVPLLKPYLAAGPSFRAVSASLAEHMSAHGITAGIGVETHIGPMRISPEVRFTHWGGDGVTSNPYRLASYPNEVEVLAGFALASTSSAVPSPASGLLKYVSLGVKGGLPFTEAFHNDYYGTLTSSGNLSVSYQNHYASRGYLVGAEIEIHLPLNLSVEADELYRPMEVFGPLLVYNPVVGRATPLSSTTHAWEFPVVGKYRFHSRVASPYLEAGTAFRTVSSIGQFLSPAGVVAGVGVEARALHVRVSPEVRFIHWGKDAPDAGAYESRTNQAEFLLGLSY